MGDTAKTAIEAGQAELVTVLGALLAAFLALWTGKQIIKLVR